MKLHSNHILIRLTKKTDELQLPGIGTLEIETVFDEERHQRIVGIVEEVPNELVFENMNHGQMPWECEMEARIGDEVILRRTDVSSSRFHGKSYEVDGHLYVYVPYTSVILVKREVYRSVIENEDFEIVKDTARRYMDNGPFIGSDGFVKPFDFSFDRSQTIFVDDKYFEVIMLNGFMLVEQDELDLGPKLTLPENIKESKAQTGTIRFIGKPNKRYHEQFESNGTKIQGLLPDNRFDLKVGDKIGFLKFASIDLEFDLHRTFGGKGLHFVRMQRNKILCKLD